MALRLANRPQAQLGAMAGALADCRDPWARHWLVVPGQGRGEWLQRHWARLSGVAARSQLVTVRALVELAAAGSGTRPPFDIDALSLAIAHRIPVHAQRLPLPIPDRTEAIDRRRLGWARQLADAIDMGLLCREPHERFRDQPGLQALADDEQLAPVLERHLGSMSNEAFANQAQAWMAAWEARGGLPYLWLALDVGLPSVLMARLAQLLQLLPADRVHVHALAPSPVYWGDLRTGRRHDEDAELDPGPVLGPFGRRAQDLHNQLIDCFLSEGSGGEEDEIAPSDEHLLGLLQRTCAEAAPPVAAAAQADDSFSVHACRSPLRELEVCRDRLLQAMHEDDSLQPEDCLLLLADAATYAPLIGAALQPQPNGEQQIPFRLVGTGTRADTALATGIRAVLAACTGRCTQQDLLQLLEHPLVAERFDLIDEQDDASILLSWVQDAGFRWGIDAAHRSAVQQREDDRWHLQFALRRLTLGALVTPSQRDRIVDDAVPLDRTSGLGVSRLARLTRLADALAAVRADWPEDKAPMASWCQRCRDLMELLGLGSAADQEQRAALLNHSLPRLLHHAPPDALLTRDAFRLLLDTELSAVSTSVGGGGGGVTVAPLVEFAGTPARMVLICGLGEDTFPRRDERPGWHPLATSRRTGDPQRRDDDRHALLLALLAAEERLVLSYQGGSDADAKERPPSTALSDLITAALQLCDDSFYVHHHPLNGFSPAAHRASLPAAARGFLVADHHGASALAEHAGSAAHASHEPTCGLWRQALDTAIDPDEPIDARALATALKQPLLLFTRQLGLDLADEEEATRNHDRLDLDALEQWHLRRRLIRHRLAGGSDNDLHLICARSGAMPPGSYGDQAWSALSASAPLAPQHEVHARHCGGRLTAIDADERQRPVDAELRQEWWRDEDGHVHCFSASKQKDGCDLLPWRLDFLILSLLDATTAGSVHFARTNGADRVLPLERAPGIDVDGTRLLGRVVDLIDCARRLPLPWWPTCHRAMQRRLEQLRRSDADCRLADSTIADDLIRAGNEAFAGEDHFGAFSPPADSVAARLCFRDCADPFLWTGPVGATLPDWLPLPEAPLALRLFAAFADLEADLAVATSSHEEVAT